MKNLRYYLSDFVMVFGVLIVGTAVIGMLSLFVPPTPNCLGPYEQGTIHQIDIRDEAFFLTVHVNGKDRTCTKSLRSTLLRFEIGQNISRDNHLTIGVLE